MITHSLSIQFFDTSPPRALKHSSEDVRHFWTKMFVNIRPNAVKNTFCQEFLQIKVVKDSISYKKVSGCIYLSTHRVELGGFEELQF